MIHLYNGQYYSLVKNNVILKFAGKWMDLEKTYYWSNSDSERCIYYVLTHKWLLDIKKRKTSLQFTIPDNLDNKENPKKDIHGSK